VILFLDTEFTDFPKSEQDLISIGLVDENGRDFYAELTDYRQEACSPFVKQVVLPLLKKYPKRVEGTKWEVAKRLNEWLQLYKEDCVICFDYHADWDLTREMLMLLPDEDIPDFIVAKNIWGAIDKNKFELYFTETQLTPHMALYDAYANRAAFNQAYLHVLKGRYGN